MQRPSQQLLRQQRQARQQALTLTIPTPTTRAMTATTTVITAMAEPNMITSPTNHCKISLFIESVHL